MLIMTNKIYYSIHTHHNHVHDELVFSDMEGFKAGSLCSLDKIIISADDSMNWKWTLESLDFLRSFPGQIVSKRFKEAMEGLYTEETVQFIPTEIKFKRKTYKDFYILNPLISMSIFDPMETYWSIERWRKDDSYRSHSSYVEYCYSDDILEENYKLYPHIHFFRSSMTTILYVSKDVREAAKKYKLKLDISEMRPSNMLFSDDLEQGKTLNDEFRKIIWEEYLKESYNYEFLKSKFDWIK